MQIYTKEFTIKNLKGFKSLSSFILSGAISISLPAHAASWTATGSPATARNGHTATMLTNGKVLVAGGYEYSGYLTSAELYNPATGDWVQTGFLATGRSAHTATLLTNGKVLVAGGYGNSGHAELYDPVTEQWNTAGSPTVLSSYGQTATRLTNGKVLVVGGRDTQTGEVIFIVELYDPATGVWTATGSLATGRVGHTATLLTNGKVLVAGGHSDISGAQYPTSTTLYDSATGQWNLTGSLTTGRYLHSATLLPNGKVLVAGGSYWSGGTTQFPTVAELYDPATGQWTQTGSLVTGRQNPIATLLPNGKVLVDGNTNTNSSVIATDKNSELYNPATGQWSATAAPAAKHDWHTATLLPNGQVLSVGNTAELYTPDSITTTTTLTSSLNPSNLNQNVTFTAKVAATPVPTGTVTFKVDGATKAATTLSNGQTTYATTSLTLGNHTIRAEYAGNSTWASSAAQLTQAVSAGADFVITNLSLNPAAPAAGQALTVRVAVKNSSTVSGTAGNLSLFLDKAAAAGCNVASDKVVTIGTLAAGASKTLTITVSAPSTSSGTPKTLRVFADSACATAETSESNNQATKTYTVGAPDLTVTSITLNPVAPATGATFTAQVVVKNLGSISSSTSFLDLWTNQPTSQTCGAAGEQWATIEALAAGASQTITFSGLSAATAGTKTLRVYADSWCEGVDANRNNNQLTKTYTVAASADFVVNSVTLIPSSPAANSTFNAIVVVTNQGTAAGNGGNLTVWANQTVVQTCGAAGNKSIAVGTLAAGATSALTVSGLAAGTAGTKTLRAFVDNGCVTAESNDANNQLTQSYTVE